MAQQKTKIYQKLVPSGGNKVLVIDEETYCPVNPIQIPTWRFYSQKQGPAVADKYKFNKKKQVLQKIYGLVGY